MSSLVELVQPSTECFFLNTGFSSVRLSHLKRTLSTWHFCSCSEAFLRQLLQPWIRWSETPFRKFGDFGVSLCRTWGLILSTGAIFFDILNQQTNNKIRTPSDRGGRIWALRCAFGIQSCIWELLDWSMLLGFDHPHGKMNVTFKSYMWHSNLTERRRDATCFNILWIRMPAPKQWARPLNAA